MLQLVNSKLFEHFERGHATIISRREQRNGCVQYGLLSDEDLAPALRTEC
jgi:hypothetical protein